MSIVSVSSRTINRSTPKNAGSPVNSTTLPSVIQSWRIKPRSDTPESYLTRTTCSRRNPIGTLPSASNGSTRPGILLLDPIYFQVHRDPRSRRSLEGQAQGLGVISKDNPTLPQMMMRNHVAEVERLGRDRVPGRAGRF